MTRLANRNNAIRDPSYIELKSTIVARVLLSIVYLIKLILLTHGRIHQAILLGILNISHFNLSRRACVDSVCNFT